MAYMTDEQRKEKFFFMGEHYNFHTCNDLSIGIQVKLIYATKNNTDINKEWLSRDIMSFTAQWCCTVFDKLNGFPGFSRIDWIFHN